MTELNLDAELAEFTPFEFMVNLVPVSGEFESKIT